MDITEIDPRRVARFPWLIDLPNLSPDSFPWNEWEGDNSWLCCPCVDTVDLPDDWVAIGWIDGEKLIVRPKLLTIAVKFNDGARDFWQHIID